MKVFRQEFNPTIDRWIVADLANKVILQEDLLLRFDGLPDDSLLTIEEFWQELWLKAKGHLPPEERPQFVHHFFIESELRKNLRQMSQENSLFSEDQALEALAWWDYFSPLYSRFDAQAGEQVLDSLRESATEIEPWLIWAITGRGFDEHLRKKKWFSSTRVGLYLWQWLQSEPGEILVFLLAQSLRAQTLWIDLGLSAQGYEIELLRSLGRACRDNWTEPNQSQRSSELRINVLVPRGLTKAYWLIQRIYGVSEPMIENFEQEWESPFTSRCQASRFDTVLDEVRWVVEKIQSDFFSTDLNAGDQFDREQTNGDQTPGRILGQTKKRVQKILVTEPSIYVPVFERVAEEKGVRVRSLKKDPLLFFPQVQKFISLFELSLGQVSLSHLQWAFGEILRGDELQQLWDQGLYCYQKEDLPTAFVERVGDYWPVLKNPCEELDIRGFLSWSFSLKKHFRDEEFILIEQTLGRFFLSVPEEARLQASDWLIWLKRSFKDSVRLVPRNRLLRNELPSGDILLDLEPLSSCFSIEDDPIYVVGLSEAYIKGKPSTKLKTKQVEKIAREHGFILDTQSLSHSEFFIHWLLHSNSKRMVMTTSLTSPRGEVLSPCALFLELEALTDKKSKTEIVFEKRVPNQSPLTDTLDPHFFPTLKKISSSDLGQFLDCPYKFLLERILRFSGSEPQDVDPDARVKGTLVHLALQICLNQIRDERKIHFQDRKGIWCPLANSRSFSQSIEAKVAAGLEQAAHQFGAGMQWFLNIRKNEILQIAKQFCEFELEWQSQQPNYKDSLTEVNFHFWVDRTSLEAVSDLSRFTEADSGTAGGSQWVEVRGTIDRLDIFADAIGRSHAVIVDYKARDEAKYSFSRWIQDNYLQLGFYVWAANQALKLGLFRNHQIEEVVGAQIISYQTMERGRGFLLESWKSIGGRLSQMINPSDLSVFTIWFESQLKNLFEQVELGEFPAEPRKKDQCMKCAWSQVCQAPHLQ